MSRPRFASLLGCAGLLSSTGLLSFGALLAALLLAPMAASAAVGDLVGKLVPPDGGGRSFGFDLAATRGVAIVADRAAPTFDIAARRPREASLSPEPLPGVFLSTLAADSGLLLGGAPTDDADASLAGGAYLYDARSGAQLRRLAPDDPAAGARFGTAVDLGGRYAIVGDNRGAAYTFTEHDGRQLVKLTPDDPDSSSSFGRAVGMHRLTAIVGDARDGQLGDNAGAAWLFDAISGAVKHKLLPDDGQGAMSPSPLGDLFGSQVEIDDGLALVGSPRNDNENGVDAGAAYVFDAETGEQLHKLTPSDGGQFERFGYELALDGDYALISSQADVNEPRSGAAYLFNARTGKELARLMPDPEETFSLFGSSVAIDGSVALVSTRRGSAEETTAIYLFSLVPEPGGLALAAAAAVPIAGLRRRGTAGSGSRAAGRSLP